MSIERETVPAGRGEDWPIFYFDPLCPWAWRASEWIREVQAQTGLQVEWCIFSLAEANGLGEEAYLSVRVKALIWQRDGDGALARAYRAVGTALHERGRDRHEGPVPGLRVGLREAGFDPGLVEEAATDPSTLEQVRRSHREAVDRFGAYGVPWLVIPGCDFNGPVIDTVPGGGEAVTMWRALHPLLSLPHFYELKRARRTPVGAASR